MPDSTSFFGDAPAERPEGFDGYGRYLLNVDGLGDKPYTRVTTLAKALENTFALENYANRVAALGVARRPDLVARANVTPLDDKKNWREILKQAEVVSGADVKANMGTAFHQFHEQVGSMSNEEYAAVPHELRVTYERYRAELDRLGIVEILTEATVANTAIGTAGTLDGLVKLADGRVVIADRKTGRFVEYPHAPCAQLATYSHSDRIRLPDGTWINLSDIEGFDPSVGLVFDIKIGDEKTASVHVYEVDLEAGWYAALLATKVRRWRTRKDLVTPYQPEFKPVTVATQLLPISQELAAELPPVVATTATPPKEQTPEAWGLTARQVAEGEHTQLADKIRQVAEGEHTQLADKIRQAAELALSSPNPEAVAAGERLLSKDTETKQAAAMAELDAADPSGLGINDLQAEDSAALLKIYKTKAALQAVARQVDPQMNVARQRGNLASDMVSHPNWPGKRKAVLGLTETAEEEGRLLGYIDPVVDPTQFITAPQTAEPLIAHKATEWMPTADEVKQATPGTEVELLGNVPEQANPYGGEAPAADPPSAPLSDEDRYIQRVAACDSKQAIGEVWQAAQAEGVEWTARLHQAASARIATFTP